MSMNARDRQFKRVSFSKSVFYKLLSKIEYGQITLVNFNDSIVFKGKVTENLPCVTIFIHHQNVYKSLLWEGSIGAGRSYMQGDWETDDLSGVIELFILNNALFSQIETPISKLFQFLLKIKNYLYSNTKIQAKKNILSHYDLGNEFFELFLDPTMMYSCALYDPPSITLESASIMKLESICQSLELKPSDHILEIGSGWGGFAIYAATQYGCKVTTTTISDKQYSYVKNKVNSLNLTAQVRVLNQDYRELEGVFDKLVSIEMIEAIGHRYFDAFFKICYSRLKPGGLFFLQSIVINDKSYDASKNEIDFIKHFIFPGGCLPSVARIKESVAKKTHFELLKLQDIGTHYAITLRDWKKNLFSNRDLIKSQGFDDSFLRMWEFYFCYCIAGFKTRYISDIHALWKK